MKHPLPLAYTLDILDDGQRRITLYIGDTVVKSWETDADFWKSGQRVEDLLATGLRSLLRDDKKDDKAPLPREVDISFGIYKHRTAKVVGMNIAQLRHWFKSHVVAHDPLFRGAEAWSPTRFGDRNLDDGYVVKSGDVIKFLRPRNVVDPTPAIAYATPGWFAGRTVADALMEMAATLPDVSPDAVPYIRGVQVTEGHILTSDEPLELRPPTETSPTEQKPDDEVVTLKFRVTNGWCTSTSENYVGLTLASAREWFAGLLLSNSKAYNHDIETLIGQTKAVLIISGHEVLTLSEDHRLQGGDLVEFHRLQVPGS